MAGVGGGGHTTGTFWSLWKVWEGSLHLLQASPSAKGTANAGGSPVCAVSRHPTAAHGRFHPPPGSGAINTSG